MTTLGKTMRAVVKSLWDDARAKPKELEADADDTTDERHKGKCYGQAALWRDIERRIQSGLRMHDVDWLFDTTTDDSLKNEILRQWTACRTKEQRHQMLQQIEAARHEIRIECLPSEPELRITINKLESLLSSIMLDTYFIGECHLHRDGSDGADMYRQREAPLVGLAGHIAALLYLRAAQQGRTRAELGGDVVHETRWLDASKARSLPAKPSDGFTANVAPIDPLSVQCRACGAVVGSKCVQLVPPKEHAST